MNIFITGATGFIGGSLVRELLGAGHGVWAWVRSVERARQKLPVSVTLVPVDGGDAALDDALRVCDALVHMAGESVAGRRWSADHKRRILDSRVSTTRALVESCARLRAAGEGPSVFVSTSASGYYGDTGDRRADESAPAGSDFLAGVCVAWEREAVKAEALGMRVPIIRVGIVFGRQGGALEKLVPPIKMGVGGPLGPGTQYMPWIHERDLVRIYVNALTDERVAGPINASAPAPATNAEVVRAIGAVVRRPTLLRVPKFALKIAVGGLADVLVEGQRMIPAALQGRGFEFEFPELEPALRDLLL